MTKDEVRDDYKISGSFLVLDDNESDVFYFSYGECPIWRYRFEKNRLVAFGYLVMEVGMWYYIETDYRKTRRKTVRDFDEHGKIIFKVIRTDPKYDEDGGLIGVERTVESTSTSPP